MIGGSDFLSEENYIFAPKKPFSAKMIEKEQGRRDPFTMTKVGTALPRAIIFRDSFFTAMVPFVAEHFSVSRFIWERWNSRTQMDEILDEFNPDIVIEETVERLIEPDGNFFAQGIPSYLATTVAGVRIETEKRE
jgi:hypothetical protein